MTNLQAIDAELTLPVQLPWLHGPISIKSGLRTDRVARNFLHNIYGRLRTPTPIRVPAIRGETGRPGVAGGGRDTKVDCARRCTEDFAGLLRLSQEQGWRLIVTERRGRINASG
jgi:hypothetical protein